MQTQFLFDILKGYQPFETLLRALDTPCAAIAAHGLTGSQRAHLACAVSARTGRPLLYLCGSEKAAAKVTEDIRAMMEGGIVQMPARDITFYQDVAAGREVAHRRLEAMQRMMTGEAKAVVAPMDVLLHRMMPRDVFAAHTVRLAVGDRLEITDLSLALLDSGYSREVLVEGKGQFCVRGGLLDVFPSDARVPLRIEFFDDEVDSIRSFEIISQRSVENLKQAVIPPACEAPVPIGEEAAAARAIRELLTEMGKPILPEQKDEETDPDDPLAMPFLTENRTYLRFREVLENAAEQAERGISSRALEKLIHLIYSRTESVCDYLNRPIVVLDDPAAVFDRLDSKSGEFVTAYTAALERGEASRRQETLMLQKDEVIRGLSAHTIIAESSMLCRIPQLKLTQLISMDGISAIGYSGNTKALCDDLRRWQRDGWRVLILSGGSARGERLRQSCEDVGIETVFDEIGRCLPAPGESRIYPMALSESFQYPSIRVAVIAEGDAHTAGAKKARFSKKESQKIDAFTDLQPGDYVVHETLGIGRYLGMKQLTSSGVSRDYMLVEYLGEDRLYIPMDGMDRIQKYIGSGESAPPKLSHMGGREWDKQKKRVRESVKALAFNLVALYAQRQKNQGYAFGPDTSWQTEFEENFPYEETPDQLAAVEEIKRDMELARPMDRLLCGDVGYGKTEVALRAAFKAILDGKQVAVLAPTTILVQQHFNTIQRRFEGFPIRAEVLSRFRTPKQQKESIERLKLGEADIVVGTHRLLSKEIQFKDLGLLIVDEEQRFGVGHKETIKNLKQSVDVLTLSATPIPRTLHMSMVGIRDMSLLETPPQARYPVQTYVMEFQEGVIRDAILRELGRGGQVFFLYNYVESIDRCYDMLHQLVPEARIAIAHGQMKESVLEDVMLDFSQQKFDVLLCTTIIESGLDIPMANTLIVYDADRFGLAQLYQTRGRVGRSNRVAYAYLTVRSGKVLTEVAQKRLDAIREFTEFGSGFRIAMRDLELRGAGNLLGPEQSGHLAEIGYDLYCKLLEEAIQEVQGITPAPNRDLQTQMNVRVNAFLPQGYVSGEKLRIEVYKRIAAITSSSDRDDIEEELLDRFGEEPKEVANLVSVAYLKAMCNKLGIDRVTQADHRIEMRFSEKAQVDGAALFKALNGFDRRLRLQPGQPPKLVLTDDKLGNEDMLGVCVRMMERLHARMAQ